MGNSEDFEVTERTAGTGFVVKTERSEGTDEF